MIYYKDQAFIYAQNCFLFFTLFLVQYNQNIWEGLHVGVFDDFYLQHGKYLLFMTKSYQTSLIFVVLSSLICIASGSIVFSYKDSRINYFGRYYADQSGLKYDWPCFTIQFCFANATKIWWLGYDNFNHYQVILNDNATTTLIPKLKSKVQIYDNSQPNLSEKCIKIVKITEDHYGPLGTIKDSLFTGVQMEGNNPQLVKKFNNFDYKLQFIGDSLTSAFGDMSGTNIKCFFRMRHNQNCLESWATHLSKKLNAQYRIQAQSGKGVVKNSVAIPGKPMSDLFTKITSNSQINSYHYQDKYQPDAVLVFLGINDHNSPIKPGKDNFIYAYEKMLNEIINMQYNKDKKTKIISICSADFPESVCNEIKIAVNSFKYAYNHAYYVQVPAGIFKKADMGCIGHWNYKGQRIMAESIYQSVKSILDH